MKFLKKLFIFVIVVAVALSVIAQFLPAHFRVERGILIQAGADKIFPLINELKRWPEWTAWTTEMDPTLTYTYEGPAEGVGAVCKWDGKKAGPGVLTLTASDPATGVKYDMNMGGCDSKGWIRFAPAGSDTKVLIGFEGDLSRNPIHRWMGLMIEKIVAPDFDKGLAKLKRVVEAK